jgi:amicoumacin kinase
MEERIRERFHDDIFQAIIQRFGIADGQIRSLDAFESFIYEFERDGAGYILRIGHSLRRSEALIQGEVDWINYLAEGGVSVSRAIHSEHGKLVEVVEDGQGGQFLATAFVKAQGKPPWVVGWTPALYETYGELLGRIHARTRSYHPVQPAWKRPEWDDDIFEFVDHFLPATEVFARQRYHALLKHLHHLPKDSHSYGLIHQDAHSSNLMVDGSGRLTLFDFDDCGYSWFINEIAIVLFYIAQDAEDIVAFTRSFMSHLLRGYQKVCVLDPRWLKEIPNFLKVREIELYAAIHRDFDIHNIDNQWCARFMHKRKSLIEQNVPFIDFDFETLAEQLS